ncbi:MAG: integrase arm-type DNA-binding domain-containing protein [Steroidobacteraceae bacterium]
MPPVHRLTDAVLKAAVRAAPDRPGRPHKVPDGGGLHLLVAPTGACLWRLRYRYGGVEKLLALGRYPEVTLKRAREKRAEARQLLDRKIDPSAQRKAERLAAAAARASSLETVAEEWFGHYRREREQSRRPLAPATVEKTEWLLGIGDYRSKKTRGDGPHPLRALAGRAMNSITQDDIAKLIGTFRRRDRIETARRLLERLDRIFRFAIATGRATVNAAAAFRDSPDPRDRLPPITPRHHAAITEPRQVGALLRAIHGYRGHAVTEAALELAPLVFVRPIELRGATWSEFDLAAGEWRIPAARTKMRREHIVPLATQSIEILRELHDLTGPAGLVFPSLRDAGRPLSENTINAALRRLGYTHDQMTGHGFRSIAATLLREQGHDSELIERQLGHAVGSDVARAYDRSLRLPERRRMMQAWADHLDHLRLDKGDEAAPKRKRARKSK